MTKSYVNLHTHGIFSLLDGLGTYEGYAERVKELGMGAIGITEHGNVHGWVDFYKTCKDMDVKPILGIELYQARKGRYDRDEEERAGKATFEWEQRGPYHLTALARNNVGYHNLIKLSSRAFLEGFYVKPRMDLDLLAEHAEGLIILSGCLGGAVQQALLRGDYKAALNHAATMQDIVGKDNYYIEMQDHGLPEQKQNIEGTIQIAKEIGAKIVATGDCHYVHKHDHDAHDTMICITTKSLKATEDRFKFFGPEFYLKSYEEMAQVFEDEWLSSSLEIAESVEVDISFDDFHFPAFPDTPKDKTAHQLLEEMVEEGLKTRYGDPVPAPERARATHELGVIGRMGFSEYFLVVADLINWGKSQGIRFGAGRGSAAGSIVSYCIGITNLDPLKYGLMFERFLIEGRKTMPDIDIDIDDRHRDRMIEYARQKYGVDRVANIVTFFSEGTKSAIHDAARVLGYDMAITQKISNMIPPPVLGVSKTIEESLETPELKAAYENDKDIKIIIDSAKTLEGVYRQVGVHAAGVVITPGPLIDHMPIMQKGEAAVVTTQWDGSTIEDAGFLKIDFLGLRNLGIVDMCIDSIEKNTGDQVDIENMEMDDPIIYEALSKGESVGLFQLESEKMGDMMLALQPSEFNDIMALISLYRPGPLGSGMDKMYINRKHGRERVSYPHPSLEEALKNSRGILLYQEDVLRTCQILAGFSVSDADDLRRVIGKKKIKEVAKYREKFVEGAMTTSNISRDLANKIYSDIEYFAGYGFNLAHACSYAWLSYVTAWLKSYYPKEYMAACLTSVSDNKDRLALYLRESKRMGIEVIPPNINLSEKEFVVKEDKIVYGFYAIDGIGDSVTTSILKVRDPEKPWDNFYDFLRRSDPPILNKQAITRLISSGTLDSILPKKDSLSFGISERMEILEEERALLGIYMTGHPLDTAWIHLEKDITHTIDQLLSSPGKATVRLGGVVQSAEHRYTKTGKPIINLKIEDLTGSIRSNVFSTAMGTERVDPDLIKPGAIGFFDGWCAIDPQTGAIQAVNLRKFTPIDPKLLFGGNPIILEAKSCPTRKTLISLGEIITNNPGPSPIFLSYPEGDKKVTLQYNSTVAYNMRQDLENLLVLGEYSVA